MSSQFIEKGFDVIVIGVGHAGIEAAMASARLGCKTLLMGMNLETVGQMSCNPAIGGPAKSQLVKEIDALGGVMGICADATYIQLKTLNSSKGPAVQALRAQSDKTQYRQFARELVESEPNITLRQAMAIKLHINKVTEAITGVEDNLGILYPCKAVVLANGTFLNGKLFIGEKVVAGGRSGEAAATGITADLIEAGHTTGRLKTGTPPRLDGRTIDYSNLDIHPGDKEPSFFSFLPNRPVLEQLPCHMTFTNAKTHEIIQQNIHRSPMFQGMIEGSGPRYCPSIEDKVVRFADKERHHLFVEPEGRTTYEVYLQGFSSSLPIDVQQNMLKTLPGLENVVMIRPACAVEYDYFPAFHCYPSLMSKHIEGVFLAGQINGTSGYEEAAAQGLMAGINAARFVGQKEPFVLPRESSYIGTLIDDLVTKEIFEPYRMLTSRSEYRLLLRQDNADSRLTELGKDIGLVDDLRWQTYQQKQQTIGQLEHYLNNTRPELPQTNMLLTVKQQATANEKLSLMQLLKRPEITFEDLRQNWPQELSNFDKAIWFYVETEAKYQGYIQKQSKTVERLNSSRSIKLPQDLDYETIIQLSKEAREKLNTLKPDTLGQAMRIPGVSPSDISIIQVLMAKRLQRTEGSQAKSQPKTTASVI